MSRKCWPWNHQWGKWVVTISGTIEKSVAPAALLATAHDPSQWYTAGTWKRQERTCEVCGRLQMRLVKT